MKYLDPLQNSQMKSQIRPVLLTLALLAIVTFLDYVTGPTIDFSIVYFLPITFAAWAIGRGGALSTAVFAEIPTCLDHISLIRLGDQDPLQAVSSVIVRFFVYLFVAEVTVRLAQSNRAARRSAEELERVNVELRHTYDRLDEDASAGGMLQEALLAFELPSVPGCEVGARLQNAFRVGGDFVDVGLIDGRVYVCVGDISGKGTPAALFTALLKYLLKDAHRRGLRGGEVVSYLNPALCRGLPDERFVTLFYAEIEPGSGRVHYANAGHLEGLIYRRSSDVIDLLGPTAPILAVSDSFSQDLTSTAVMRDGDVLVLYTDGATESKMTSGERIGEERFADIARSYAHLDAQDMVDRICEHIQSITIDGARDDIAIVSAKMTGGRVLIGDIGDDVFGLGDSDW